MFHASTRPQFRIISSVKRKGHWLSLVLAPRIMSALRNAMAVRGAVEHEGREALIDGGDHPKREHIPSRIAPSD